MDSNINNRIQQLWEKPKSEKFTEKEIAFLRKNVNTKTWKIHYVLYAKESSKERYVGLVIDYMANNPRGRLPAHHSMNVICSRELTPKEKLWEYQNWGTRNRRFVEYWYKSVQSIILMDMHYNIETPKEFIKLCEDKGYSDSVQLYLKF